MAGGLAANGMKPYVAIYSTFLQRAYDQLLHDIDRQNLDVVFGIDRSGLVGADGETHQGVFDISFLSHLPNMTVMMPKDEDEAGKMVYSAFHSYSGPIAIRYPRGNGVGVEVTDPTAGIPYGKWEVLREGKDAVVLSFGPTLQMLLEAQETLLKEGIKLEVVNARFIKPMDTDYLDSLAKRNIPVLTVEESMLTGGFGSMVVSYFNDHQQSVDVKRLGIDNEYIEQGDVDMLLQDIGLTTAHIVDEVKQLIGKTDEETAN